MSKRLWDNLLSLFVVGAALCVGIFSSRALARWHDGLRRPPLLVTPERIDFGSVLEDPSVQKTVLVTNKGHSTLHLNPAFASCGCTTANSPATIAPGQSAPITITFNTQGSKGHVKQIVWLNAKGFPETASVTLEGMVRHVSKTTGKEN